MRTPILVAAAVLALATPALAQDRTIPAGALDAAQPQIDRVAPVPTPTAVYQGRSIGYVAAPARRVRHHD